jgi:hypothetical protein
VAALALVPLGPRPTQAAPAALAIGWSKGASLPTSFSPRWDFAFGYLPAPKDKVVLFGGSPRKVNGDEWRDDTWIYDGSSWSLGPSAPAGLTPRGGATMAYLPSIGKLVMFGGIGPGWPPFDETWLFDGTKWTKGPSAPDAMAPRVGAGMVYDPDLGKLVLFGGSGAIPYKDTWLFDGTKWTSGPTAPAAMAPRSFFGMAYDPTVGKILVAGGDGETDTWWFDGTKWTAGPTLAPGPRERFRMDYDPDLGGIVMFGGIGPGVDHEDLWLLRDGKWTEVLQWTGKPWPDDDRIDGAVLWHPVKDALMLTSGIEPADAGINGLKDTWFFHEEAPSVEWVDLDPTAPNMADAVSLTKGPLEGGYRNWYYEYQWFKNGSLVAGNTDTKLTPDEGDFEPGDEIQAKVRVHDFLDVYGPWVASPVVDIVNRPPDINSATISPSKAYTSDTLTAAGNGVKDPDGQDVDLTYVWKVNGKVVGNDKATLAPSKFTAEDSVTVTITVTDEMGMKGPTVTSNPKVIDWNINEVVGSPGQARTVKGFSFQAGEKVDVKVDSPTAATQFTATAESDGSFTFTGWDIPNLPVGDHMLYGVGKTSGIVGPGPLTITADAPHGPAPGWRGWQ